MASNRIYVFREENMRFLNQTHKNRMEKSPLSCHLYVLTQVQPLLMSWEQTKGKELNWSSLYYEIKQELRLQKTGAAWAGRWTQASPMTGENSTTEPPMRTNTQKRCPFHYRGLECKSRKSRNTWSNGENWCWRVWKEAGQRLIEFFQGTHWL